MLWSREKVMGQYSSLSLCPSVCQSLTSQKLYFQEAQYLKLSLKRETESFLVAARNNAIRTNNIKARVDNLQQNSRCRLSRDRNDKINSIISEFSKSAQKEYKTRHVLVSNVIHWELCKKLKAGHTNRWNMRNPAFVLKNETHKLRWDFEIQTDYLISARLLHLMIFNKKWKLAELRTLISWLITE